ncbi:hypothetical protein FHX81_2449 [Saccharothrix saharensis]|uniref:Uncharacterized protein n=1 Tax=Saccharothrix saharensis TaxID=571190 RepID=A0A543JBI6_9PSEU|nr:hypothetical protein [Saccharothrix saharensis]TQM80126.1 hypothetical protein FHX81_2449 [Saccharothrix saharensis]
MTRFLRLHPPLMLFSLLMAALTVVSLGGLIVDDRILVGSPIWFKPFKFAVSLCLYGVTLAWMLTLTTRLRRTGWWAGAVIALAGTAEMVVVVGQVLRGRRSHFNVATPLDDLLWGVMTYSILILWIMHAVIAVALAHTRFENRATGLAIRLGLALSLVGLALGTLMTSPAPGQDDDGGIVGAHSVGAPDGGPEMALTGWNTEVGDLRVPHFVGIHALQVIPLLVALFGRRATPGLTWGLTIGYAGLMALVTWQALRGQPLLRPDLLTALGALAVVTWTAAVVARTLTAKEAVSA